MSSVTFSPDGTLLVSRSEDGTIRLWGGTSVSRVEGHSCQGKSQKAKVKRQKSKGIKYETTYDKTSSLVPRDMLFISDNFLILAGNRLLLAQENLNFLRKTDLITKLPYYFKSDLSSSYFCLLHFAFCLLT